MLKNAGRPWTPLHVLPANSNNPYNKYERRARRKSNLASLLIIFLVILLLMLVGVFFFSTKVGGKITTKATPNGLEGPASSQGLAASSGKKITVEEDCYGIVPRFSIRKVKSFNRCSILISYDSPYGSLVVDYRGNGGAATSSDILMRRANTDKYEETTTSIQENKFVLFRNKESMNFEKTAFLELKGITIGITLKSDSTLNYETEFQEILTSFYCKNGCQSATLEAL
jgi:hypothetical protein